MQVLDKIEVNQVFKNYKEMCIAIGEPILSGCSKVAQFKRWRRYFKFKVRGNYSIQIIEKYKI